MSGIWALRGDLSFREDGDLVFQCQISGSGSGGETKRDRRSPT